MTLSDFRLKRGLTQEEAAALLHVGLRSIQRYERGGVPRLEMALRMQKYSKGAITLRDLLQPAEAA